MVERVEAEGPLKLSGGPRSEEDSQPDGIDLSIDRSAEWPQTALGLA